MPGSLRRNLLETLAAPTVLLFVAAGGVAYGTAKAVVGTAYDQNLLNLAHGVANHVRLVDGQVRIALSPEAEALLRTDTTDRIFFRVRGEYGPFIAGDADLPLAPEESTLQQSDPYQSLGQPTAPEPPRSGARAPRFYDARHHAEPIRAVRLHRRLDQQSVFITVAETRYKRQDSLERLLLGFGSAAALLVAAGAIAVRFGIPSGLAPLQRLEQTLAARRGTDLAPIDLTGVPHEIHAVVQALNAMLARLREANADQRRFLQDAAHQLRTPLASLQVQLELLGGQPATQAQQTRLLQSVTRITRLANQLLALARAEAGARLMADADRVDLGALIDDMVEDWLRIADGKGIDFGVQREAVTMKGDPTLLRELIANLVDNALKYTPPGGQVTLRCAAAGDTVDIDVDDDGPGIPEAAREQVFERFYRLADAAASGSGLGLPIAREIAHCHGGTIAIGSAEGGRGTRVAVRLPRNA